MRTSTDTATWRTSRHLRHTPDTFDSSARREEWDSKEIFRRPDNYVSVELDPMRKSESRWGTKPAQIIEPSNNKEAPVTGRSTR